MECSDYTEICVHDANTRVSSLMFYDGVNNNILIGRNKGWGSISNVILNGILNINNGDISYIRCGANSTGYFLNIGSISTNSLNALDATTSGI